MNPTAPRPSQTVAHSHRTHGTSQRHDTCDDARCAGDFERLLRDKAGQHAPTESHDEPSLPVDALLIAPRTEPSPTPPNAALPATKALAPISTPPSPGAMPPTAIDNPAAAQLNLLATTSPATADTARAFEVSVKQPLGVGLELRATRPVQAGESHAGARWSLSISSTNLNPSVMRRYSTRLDERLSSRELPHEPVRIENDEEPR